MSRYPRSSQGPGSYRNNHDENRNDNKSHNANSYANRSGHRSSYANLDDRDSTRDNGRDGGSHNGSSNSNSRDNRDGRDHVYRQGGDSRRTGRFSIQPDRDCDRDDMPISSSLQPGSLRFADNDNEDEIPRYAHNRYDRDNRDGRDHREHGGRDNTNRNDSRGDGRDRDRHRDDDVTSRGNRDRGYHSSSYNSGYSSNNNDIENNIPPHRYDRGRFQPSLNLVDLNPRSESTPAANGISSNNTVNMSTNNSVISREHMVHHSVHSAHVISPPQLSNNPSSVTTSLGNSRHEGGSSRYNTGDGSTYKPRNVNTNVDSNAANSSNISNSAPISGHDTNGIYKPRSRQYNRNTMSDSNQINVDNADTTPIGGTDDLTTFSGGATSDNVVDRDHAGRVEQSLKKDFHKNIFNFLTGGTKRGGAKTTGGITPGSLPNNLSNSSTDSSKNDNAGDDPLAKQLRGVSRVITTKSRVKDGISDGPGDIAQQVAYNACFVTDEVLGVPNFHNYYFAQNNPMLPPSVLKKPLMISAILSILPEELHDVFKIVMTKHYKSSISVQVPPKPEDLTVKLAPTPAPDPPIQPKTYYSTNRGSSYSQKQITTSNTVVPVVVTPPPPPQTTIARTIVTSEGIEIADNNDSTLQWLLMSQDLSQLIQLLDKFNKNSDKYDKFAVNYTPTDIITSNLDELLKICQQNENIDKFDQINIILNQILQNYFYYHLTQGISLDLPPKEIEHLRDNYTVISVDDLLAHIETVNTKSSDYNSNTLRAEYQQLHGELVVSQDSHTQQAIMLLKKESEFDTEKINLYKKIWNSVIQLRYDKLKTWAGEYTAYLSEKQEEIRQGEENMPLALNTAAQHQDVTLMDQIAVSSSQSSQQNDSKMDDNVTPPTITTETPIVEDTFATVPISQQEQLTVAPTVASEATSAQVESVPTSAVVDTTIHGSSMNDDETPAPLLPQSQEMASVEDPTPVAEIKKDIRVVEESNAQQMVNEVATSPPPIEEQPSAVEIVTPATDQLPMTATEEAPTFLEQVMLQPAQVFPSANSMTDEVTLTIITPSTSVGTPNTLADTVQIGENANKSSQSPAVPNKFVDSEDDEIIIHHKSVADSQSQIESNDVPKKEKIISLHEFLLTKKRENPEFMDLPTELDPSVFDLVELKTTGVNIWDDTQLSALYVKLLTKAPPQPVDILQFDDKSATGIEDAGGERRHDEIISYFYNKFTTQRENGVSRLKSDLFCNTILPRAEYEYISRAFGKKYSADIDALYNSVYEPQAKSSAPQSPRSTMMHHNSDSFVEFLDYFEQQFEAQFSPQNLYHDYKTKFISSLSHNNIVEFDEIGNIKLVKDDDISKSETSQNAFFLPYTAESTDTAQSTTITPHISSHNSMIFDEKTDYNDSDDDDVLPRDDDDIDYDDNNDNEYDGHEDGLSPEDFDSSFLEVLPQHFFHFQNEFPLLTKYLLVKQQVDARAEFDEYYRIWSKKLVNIEQSPKFIELYNKCQSSILKCRPELASKDEYDHFMRLRITTLTKLNPQFSTSKAELQESVVHPSEAHLLELSALKAVGASIPPNKTSQDMLDRYQFFSAEQKSDIFTFNLNEIHKYLTDYAAKSKKNPRHDDKIANGDMRQYYVKTHLVTDDNTDNGQKLLFSDDFDMDDLDSPAELFEKSSIPETRTKYSLSSHIKQKIAAHYNEKAAFTNAELNYHTQQCHRVLDDLAVSHFSAIEHAMHVICGNINNTSYETLHNHYEEVDYQDDYSSVSNRVQRLKGDRPSPDDELAASAANEANTSNNAEKMLQYILKTHIKQNTALYDTLHLYEHYLYSLLPYNIQSQLELSSDSGSNALKNATSTNLQFLTTTGQSPQASDEMTNLDDIDDATHPQQPQEQDEMQANDINETDEPNQRRWIMDKYITPVTICKLDPTYNLPLPAALAVRKAEIEDKYLSTTKSTRGGKEDKKSAKETTKDEKRGKKEDKSFTAPVTPAPAKLRYATVTNDLMTRLSNLTHFIDNLLPASLSTKPVVKTVTVETTTTIPALQLKPTNAASSTYTPATGNTTLAPNASTIATTATTTPATTVTSSKTDTKVFYPSVEYIYHSNYNTNLKLAHNIHDRHSYLTSLSSLYQRSIRFNNTSAIVDVEYEEEVSTTPKQSDTTPQSTTKVHKTFVNGYLMWLKYVYDYRQSYYDLYTKYKAASVKNLDDKSINFPSLLNHTYGMLPTTTTPLSFSEQTTSSSTVTTAQSITTATPATVPPVKSIIANKTVPGQKTAGVSTTHPTAPTSAYPTSLQGTAASKPGYKYLKFVYNPQMRNLLRAVQKTTSTTTVSAGGNQPKRAVIGNAAANTRRPMMITTATQAAQPQQAATTTAATTPAPVVPQFPVLSAAQQSVMVSNPGELFVVPLFQANQNHDLGAYLQKPLQVRRHKYFLFQSIVDLLFNYEDYTAYLNDDATSAIPSSPAAQKKRENVLRRYNRGVCMGSLVYATSQYYRAMNQLAISSCYDDQPYYEQNTINYDNIDDDTHSSNYQNSSKKRKLPKISAQDDENQFTNTTSITNVLSSSNITHQSNHSITTTVYQSNLINPYKYNRDNIVFGYTHPTTAYLYENSRSSSLLNMYTRHMTYSEHKVYPKVVPQRVLENEELHNYDYVLNHANFANHQATSHLTSSKKDSVLTTSVDNSDEMNDDQVYLKNVDIDTTVLLNERNMLVENTDEYFYMDGKEPNGNNNIMFNTASKLKDVQTLVYNIDNNFGINTNTLVLNPPTDTDGENISGNTMGDEDSTVGDKRATSTTPNAININIFAINNPNLIIPHTAAPGVTQHALNLLQQQQVIQRDREVNLAAATAAAAEAAENAMNENETDAKLAPSSLLTQPTQILGAAKSTTKTTETTSTPAAIAVASNAISAFGSKLPPITAYSYNAAIISKLIQSANAYTSNPANPAVVQRAKQKYFNSLQEKYDKYVASTTDPTTAPTVLATTTTTSHRSSTKPFSSSATATVTASTTAPKLTNEELKQYKVLTDNKTLEKALRERVIYHIPNVPALIDNFINGSNDDAYDIYDNVTRGENNNRAANASLTPENQYNSNICNSFYNTLRVNTHFGGDLPLASTFFGGQWYGLSVKNYLQGHDVHSDYGNAPSDYYDDGYHAGRGKADAGINTQGTDVRNYVFLTEVEEKEYMAYLQQQSLRKANPSTAITATANTNTSISTAAPNIADDYDYEISEFAPAPPQSHQNNSEMSDIPTFATIAHTKPINVDQFYDHNIVYGNINIPKNDIFYDNMIVYDIEGMPITIPPNTYDDIYLDNDIAYHIPMVSYYQSQQHTQQRHSFQQQQLQQQLQQQQQQQQQQYYDNYEQSNEHGYYDNDGYFHRGYYDQDGYFHYDNEHVVDQNTIDVGAYYDTQLHQADITTI